MWRRLGAFWIDFLVFAPVMGLAMLLNETSRLFSLYWFIPGLLIGLWFNVWLVIRYGGTPGKLLLKMRIAMTDGSAVTTRAAVLRYIVMFALSVLASLGLLIAALQMSDLDYHSLGYMERSVRLSAMAPAWYGSVVVLMQVWVWAEFVTMLFNRKRRAVHDLMAGTVVLRQAEREQSLSPAATA